MAALAELRRELAPLPVGQGWQAWHTLHRRRELGELTACVERGVTSILRFLRIGHDAFEITGCWATVLAKGAAHKAHSHPKTSSAACTTSAPTRAPTASTFMTRDGRLR